MNTNHIPVTRSLSMAYTLSFIIAILMAAASLAGLIFQSTLYSTEELRQSFVTNDVVTLFIGLPILLGAMVLAQRGKLIGLLFWPGALFFVTYTYIAYTIATPLTIQLVVYILLAVLSGFTIFRLVSSIDGTAVKQRLEGAVPERFTGGVLVSFGILFAGLAVQALTGQTISTPELATRIADLVTIPAWVVGGVLLWRRQAFGYVTGAGLLFQASMLFVGLLVFFILQPIIGGTPFPLEDFVVVAIMSLVCFVPFGLFVRGVVTQRG